MMIPTFPSAGEGARILEVGFNAGHSVCLMMCLAGDPGMGMERSFVAMKNINSTPSLPSGFIKHGTIIGHQQRR